MEQLASKTYKIESELLTRSFLHSGTKTMNQTIIKPTLLLNETIARRNIAQMASRAMQNKVAFRPHFKTHQSAEIGEWFRENDVETITVSSVDMAVYFVQNGWRDITIAFPVNIREIEAINQLASDINLNLLVESSEVVSFLAEKLTSNVQIWLKADVGYGRTGIPTADLDKFMALVEQIETSAKLSFKGLLTHAGHIYRARGRAEIETIYHDMVNRLKHVQKDLPQALLSIGDTPSCSVMENLSAVDEIRPGNFIFYDLMQCQIGSCSEKDIAVAVACPVVAKHPERGELVIYGGAVHLSKEFITVDGQQSFGKIAFLNETEWSEAIAGAYISALSQEHGIIKIDETTMKQVKIGDLLVVLPIHSCLVVNLMKNYRILKGDIHETGNNHK
jgi:D-serine deaminase-like pyridoxal phosphate-dependent protein